MSEPASDVRIKLWGAGYRLLKRLAALKRNPEAATPIIEACLSGPGGTSKSTSAALILYWIGTTYPGCKMLVLRDKRVDLATSFMPLWEERIVPSNHPMLKYKRDRNSRQSYSFWNGREKDAQGRFKHPTIGASVIILGGMDNITRHRSTSYDVILFVELSELQDEGEWTELTRRSLRGYLESGMPFNLALGETNPDAPDHWIMRRHERGALELIESKHEDNPALWDRHTRDWTENGKAYIASLDMLHGIRKERLRYGRWVSAEGVVYENWQRKYIVDREPASDLDIRWYAAAMDWGYRDACVLLIGGVAGDGTIYIVAEWYLVGDATRTDNGIIYGSLPWWSRVVAGEHKEFDLYGLVVDPSKKEAHEQFNLDCGYTTDKPWARAADNKRADTGDGDMGGIDLVRQYIGDGKIKFFSDALRHEPDKNLVAKGKCFRTTMEFGQYVYKSTARTGLKLQNRAKELTDGTCDDHGMDCLRYLVSFVAGRDGERLSKETLALTPEDRQVADAMGRSIYSAPRAPEKAPKESTMSREDAEIARMLGRQE